MQKEQRKGFSIGTKLLLTMIVITLCPLFVASYFQFATGERAVFEVTALDLDYLTQLKARELAAYTQTLNPDAGEQQQIDAIVREVAETYYQPNGMEGYAFIIDASGNVLFHPKSDVVGTSLAHESYIQTMLRLKHGRIEYEFQGEPKLTAFAELPNGWILGIGSYREDLLKPFKESGTTQVMIALISFLAAVAIGILLVLNIIKPLRELRGAMQLAEAGNLTVEVPIRTRDELGDLARNYNNMMATFRHTLQEAQGVAVKVAAASEELSASAEENARAAEQIATAATGIAAGSEGQKDTVEQAMAIMQRIGQDIESIAASTEQVDAEAKKANQHAHAGFDRMTSLVEEMNDISDKVGASQRVIRELGAQSERIIGIISMIREISAQTNLLALNAAIEAARAGEQGRGFAVVASEVRKLAEQSGQAAEEIAELIHGIDNEIKQAVGAMEETTVAVQQGSEEVNEAGAAFREILQAVQDVSQQISRIHAAARTISQDTRVMIANGDEIARLATKAAEDTQEVAAASEQQTATIEEMTAAAETLAAMSQRLSAQIKRFTI